ncbi:sensor histidine kinase [Nonlabens ponticola]|uniref:histidine kinase n=1 Tax=Nonlabens ponticola TaxID=2496866 RepID=A0A3S9N0N1_9FLAO|nr:ATP-binding protein [Nonlabens ponticola]AZQ44949.1 hypothetical protein EJ995_12205 [Nonlabens ponticola]
MFTQRKLSSVYWIFLITIILLVLAKALTVLYYIDRQKDDARYVNLSGRQRMLSQRITKQLLYLNLKDDTAVYPYNMDSLQISLTEWKDAQQLLVNEAAPQYDNEELSTLLENALVSINDIEDEVQNVLTNESKEAIKRATVTASNREVRFLKNMDSATNLFQQEAESKTAQSRNVALILAVISLLVILLEFMLIVLPSFKALFAKNAQLEQANKQLSEFAQITAHNLRSPIGNLTFLSNFYKNAESDEEKTELFEKFDIVIGHLSETIDVLIDSIKIKAHTNVEFETLSFEKTLDHTMQLLYADLKRTNATVKADFSKAPTITYHKIYLDSIFLNLMTNSIKYRSQKRELIIVVRTVYHKDQTVMYFTDNGQGIDLDRQGDKIFNLGKTFHRNADAKGIGLFMTRNQIQALGGSIDVTSKPDEGTTFIATFKNHNGD